MSDMVERVARAICAARGQDPDSVPAINAAYDDGRPEADVAVPAWRNHIPAARAAIEAMREPTEAMLAAGQWTISDNLTVSVCVENNRKAREIWQAMVDAALKPKP